MQTTLRLDDELYRMAKAKAAATGQSLTQFLEDAVRERLHSGKQKTRRVRLPVSKARGGLAGGHKTLAAATVAADLASDMKQVR